MFSINTDKFSFFFSVVTGTDILSIRQRGGSLFGTRQMDGISEEPTQVSDIRNMVHRFDILFL